MRRPTEQAVHDSIAVILSDTKSYETSLNYAVNYCKAGLVLGGEKLRVQCLYIVNNIASWRHPQAKEVRDILRAYAKP